MDKRIRAVGVALIVALMSLLATSAMARQNVEILWLWGPTSLYTSPMQELIDRYNASQNEVFVELRFSTGTRTATYKEHLLVNIAGGTPPDIALSTPLWVREFKEKGLTVPAEALDAFNDFDREDLVPGVRDEVTVDGQMWAFIHHVETLGLFYNKSMFEAAGIGSPPATWEEFRDVGKMLTTDFDGDGKNDILGVRLYSSGAFGRWSMWMKQAGGDYLDESGRLSTVNHPGVLEALDFTSSGISEGWICGVVSGSACGFLEQNTLAMQIDFTSVIRRFEDLDIDDIETAEPPANQAASSMKGGWYLLVLDTPAQQAAGEFLRWFYKPQNQAYLASEMATVPGTFSGIDDYNYRQSFLMDNPRFIPFVNALNYSFGVAYPQAPSGTAMVQIAGIIETAINQAHSLAVPPASALEEADRLVQIELDRAWAERDGR